MMSTTYLRPRFSPLSYTVSFNVFGIPIYCVMLVQWLTEEPVVRVKKMMRNAFRNPNKFLGSPASGFAKIVQNIGISSTVRELVRFSASLGTR